MSTMSKKSEVWKYIKGKGKRAEKTIYEALDRKIVEVLDKAVVKAGEKKKTITGDDISGVLLA